MPVNRQYTIRNIPADVDRELRRRAKQLGKSFNQVALEALVSGAGMELKPRRDLSEVVGSMSAKEAGHQDEEIRLQRQIDPDLWR
jgi:plasmid stability protein